MELTAPSPNAGKSENKRWHVVIVGGGFGGLRAAQALRSARVDVTLIDRRNYHLFQPLLYQVATGSLSPGEIAAPLRGVFSRQKNTRVLLGEVVDLDAVSKRVVLADGASIEYDSLIVAAGSQTFYYGHDAWREWAPGMKSIEEATNIRHKILYAFEVAERLSDPVQRRAWLTFVIVGAGATGVELAGAIGEIARQTLKNDFRSIRPEEAEIILLDGAPRVLTPFPDDLAQKAQRSLEKLGVEVKTGVMVKDVDREGVTIETQNGRHSVPAGTHSCKTHECRNRQGRTDQGEPRSQYSQLSGHLRDRRPGAGRRPQRKGIAGRRAGGHAARHLRGEGDRAETSERNGNKALQVFR